MAGALLAAALVAGGPHEVRAPKLPPTVAAVIDYQRILNEAAAARSIREQIDVRRKAYQ